jgi:SAM-dependent methyltransferase
MSYFEAVLRETSPRRVLDIGCGTGDDVTAPLAAAFPRVTFDGVDDDAGSLRYAMTAHRRPNLGFTTEPRGPYDVVVASEVLEHVNDPVDFLRSLKGLLEGPGSTLLLTVPNGHGAFELAEIASALMAVSGLRRRTRRLRSRIGARKRSLRGVPYEGPVSSTNTLAASPHINFFSFRTVTRTLEEAGFQVEEFHGRSMVCGYGFDRIVRGPLAELNAKAADWAPRLSSGFMFRCTPADTPDTGWRYVPSRYARWKRRLNRRRTEVEEAGGSDGAPSGGGTEG